VRRRPITHANSDSKSSYHNSLSNPFLDSYRNMGSYTFSNFDSNRHRNPNANGNFYPNANSHPNAFIHPNLD
jgi:hypothetical protein